MRKHSIRAFVIGFVSVAVFSGCAAGPKLSPMQVRQLTTRLIDGSYVDTYRATLTVLQDQGYRIRETDMESGLISAYASRTRTGFLWTTQDDGLGFELSCIVDSLSDTRTEVRLGFRKSYEGKERPWLERFLDRSGPDVLDPKVFESFFNQINVEVKRRRAIRASSESRREFPDKHP